ncbi:ruBisCO-associated protein-like [Prosopis cineraria]|uniref:ruBisCO-associated protein-like n=1 Tax=Prosopis cineraria TaxID=364024 RepID=UPI00241028E7|nr:ruBisCO-associated protein-like [Prosopis cineraria]
MNSVRCIYIYMRARRNEIEEHTETQSKQKPNLESRRRISHNYMCFNMSPNPLLAYRVYASSYASIENLESVKLRNGIHVALAFARDYDEDGNPTKGDFKCYFKKDELTPTKVKTFKQNSASKVKFFLSIGGRDEKYPFSVTSSEKETWISSATQSLKRIIHHYNLDGLDIYYQYIDPVGEAQFKDAIGEVIENLKNDLPDDFLVSITVSARLCCNFYSPLYNDHHRVIDHVVYQTHTWPNVIKSSQFLTNVLDTLPYPKEKLFAGHSSSHQHSDWIKVPVPIFLGAVPHLLDNNAAASGISKWIVTSDDNPEKP